MQYSQHRGLIQWGEPQHAQYGVTQWMPVADQMRAVEKYLVNAGFKPGMGLLDMYSAVNAGRVGRYNASDANNGGAPGTVRDKVLNQMAGHREKAAALLGLTGGVPPANLGGQPMAAPPMAPPPGLAGIVDMFGARLCPVGRRKRALLLSRRPWNSIGRGASHCWQTRNRVSFSITGQR